MEEVVLYTINCPKCTVLKDKLDTLKIKYHIISDVQQLREKGIVQLPMLEVNGELINFSEALKLLKGDGLR